MQEVLVKNREFLNLVEERKSVRYYKPDEEISRDELKEILKIAGKAPSSWNLQHWKFLVLDEQDAKEKLFPISYNQQQVLDASAVIAVLGDVEADKNAEIVNGTQVKNGYMTEGVKEIINKNVYDAYENIPGIGAEEAVRNASLAAMQLMLAAKAYDYDSCPIGGFDREALIREFKIPERYMPVMLISIGKRAKDAHPTMRFSVDETTQWNSF